MNAPPHERRLHDPRELAHAPQLRHLRASLASGRALLAELDEALFLATRAPVAESSIGAHLRHVVEHVEALLAGLAERRVDYDARPRDEELERSRAHALARLEALDHALERLERLPDPGPLAVRQDGGGDPRAFAPSSLARELALLASHTIHHFALIAFLLRLEGRAVPAGFGVARSTLEWWRSREAGAGLRR